MLPEPPDRSPTTPNELGLLVVLGFFFALFIAADLAMEFTVAKLSAPFFLIAWVLLLLIHEAGHALMARLLGWRVERVSIGLGRVRGQTRCLGVPVEFRTIPLSGYVVSRPNNLKLPRVKQFLIYAAGPGIELMAAALCLVVVGGEALFAPSADPGLIALQAFSLAAAIGAGLNLIPLSHRVEGGVAWSDGLGMILCWTLKDEIFRERRDGWSE